VDLSCQGAGIRRGDSSLGICEDQRQGEIADSRSRRIRRRRLIAISRRDAAAWRRLTWPEAVPISFRLQPPI